MSKVIHSSVAGSFYPDDPKVLKNTVEELFSNNKKEYSEIPKAIIAPHAGYDYSGPTMAKAYGCLAKAKKVIKRVVIIAPSHFYPFFGYSTVDADYFETPLGKVKIDNSKIEEITKSSDQVNVLEQAFHNENSLETHLPFLQVVLGDFLLLPFLTGQVDVSQSAEILEKLWGDKETLIIASSDLSHYLDYETAQEVDKETVESILSFKPEAIDHYRACGSTAVNTLLTVASKKGLRPELIDLCNSGDVTEGKGQVVGYAAVHFYDEQGVKS